MQYRCRFQCRVNPKCHSNCSTPIKWLRRPVLTADPNIPYEDGKLKDPPYARCSHFRDTIFFTGMTQVKDKLYMYYGGSEYYTCLCTADVKK